MNIEGAVLLHGDCLELLRTLDDCSIDAVVTDPPYGLSNSARDSLSDIFIPTLIDVFFPKFNNAIAKACGSINLGRPLDRVSFLNQVNRAFWEETRVGMPESSIDFDSDIVDWNEEVKHTDKPAVTIPNRELPDVLDAHRLNNGNRFFLKLRACVNSSLGDSAAVGISDFGFGRLTVFVVIPFNSCFACFLRALSPRDSSGLADIIRLLNDPQAFSKSPASVVTGRGTELRAVLSFDVRNLTCEIKPASGTRKVDAVFEVVCPESIGTITGASSLSSMFKPHDVSFIDSTTNGAFSVCFHSFIVPHINRESSGFMGKKWDCSVPSVEIWAECLRVLKPGGHLLAFSGLSTRTQHRMAVFSIASPFVIFSC